MNDMLKQENTFLKRNYRKISIPIIAAILLLAILKNCGSSMLSDSHSGITANSWCTYTDLNILKVQNCLVSSAGLFSHNVVSVSYYPVCCRCHVMSQNLETNSASPNYPKTKIYKCDECGALTTVKLKVEI